MPESSGDTPSVSFLIDRWLLGESSLQFSSAPRANQEFTHHMPTYQYRCTACDNQFEVRQSFTDEPVTTCLNEGCEGEVKKIFGNVGIAFKGSGFYKNDSRPGSSKPSDSAGSTEDKTPSKSTNEGSASTSSSTEKSSSPDAPKKAKD